MDSEPPDNFHGRCQSFWENHWRGVLAFIIPLAYLPILFLDLQKKKYRVIYLYCVMATYWLTKVIPIYITGLLPVMLLPVMGVMDSNEVCMLYLSDVCVLFFGATLMALAIEYSNLGKRIAFKMFSLVGNDPRRILWALTFMTMFLSMWISNTSTTILMCPVVRAVVDDLDAQGVIEAYEEPEKGVQEDEEKASAISSCLFLSVAYASTIGGTGSLLGTGTNLAFKGIYDARFPTSKEYINFNMFIAYTWPMLILFTIFLCVWMQLLFLRNIDKATVDKKLAEDDKSTVRANINELGPLSAHEIQVILLFILLLLLFFTMRPGFTTGWADFLNAERIKSSWPVIIIGLLLFTLPMRYNFCQYVGGKGPFTDKEVPSLITWKFVLKNLPWGFIFLIGGGIALSQGILKSGTSTSLIRTFSYFTNSPKWCIQFFCILSIMLLTTLTWNITVTNLTIPIVAELAIGIGVHPLYLIFPAGLASSYAFLTPFSSPPNDIVMKYGNIRTKYMLLAGIGPTIVAILFVFANGNTWHRVIYPDNDHLPLWAATDIVGQ